MASSTFRAPLWMFLLGLLVLGGGCDSEGAGADGGSAARDAGPRRDGGRPPDPVEGNRPDIMDVIPGYFGFGYSSFSAVRAWPPTVRESHGVNWNYLYWYQLMEGDGEFVRARLVEAEERGVMPVLTHYQLLDRGEAAGYTGDNEWDIVIQAVQDTSVMRDYFDDVQSIMEVAADHGTYMIFQTEPDSTSFLRLFHTGETYDANNGAVAVASTGHPDLADLPNTIAGYAQALVRLRDLYAPDNVYMGLCEFDFRGGYNPEHSITFLESLGTDFDLLFAKDIVKFSRDGDWWDSYSETDQARFLTWIRTITSATGLRYIHWQTVIGPADYGLMPNYPAEERISDLVAVGSIGNLFDLYTAERSPQPPMDHPAYNSLDRLAERLGRYYANPIPLPR